MQPDEAEQWAGHHDITTAPVLAGSEWLLNARNPPGYDIDMVPTFYIISREGVIEWRVVAYQRDQILAYVAHELAEAP